MSCNHSSENWKVGLVWYGSGRSHVKCCDCDALIGSFKGYSHEIPQEWIEAKRDYIQSIIVDTKVLNTSSNKGVNNQDE